LARVVSLIPAQRSALTVRQQGKAPTAVSINIDAATEAAAVRGSAKPNTQYCTEGRAERARLTIRAVLMEIFIARVLGRQYYPYSTDNSNS